MSTKQIKLSIAGGDDTNLNNVAEVNEWVASWVAPIPVEFSAVGRDYMASRYMNSLGMNVPSSGCASATPTHQVRTWSSTSAVKVAKKAPFTHSPDLT